ncbi:MAG: response regulator [Bacteroidota bacterium]
MKVCFLPFFYLMLIGLLATNQHLHAQSFLQQKHEIVHSPSTQVERKLQTYQWLTSFYLEPFLHRSTKDSSLSHAKAYLKLAQSSSNTYHQSQAYLLFGQAYFLSGKNELGRTYLQKADSLSQKSAFSDIQLALQLAQGKASLAEGDKESAGKYFQEALENSLAVQDINSLATLYPSLAQSLPSPLDEARTEEYTAYLQKSLDLNSLAHESTKVQLAKASLLLSQHYQEVGDDSLAEVYFQQTYDFLIQVQSPDYQYKCLSLYWQLENLAYDKGLIKLEIKCLEKILAIAPTYNLDQLKASALFNLGLSYESEFSKAIRYLQWSSSFADSIQDYENQALARNNLGNFYSKNEDDDRALAYYLEADSILTAALADTFISTIGRSIVILCYPLLNAGDKFLKKGSTQEAKEKYFRAWGMTKKWGGSYDKAYVLGSVVRFFQKVGPQDSARYYQDWQEEILNSIPTDQVAPGRELFIRQNIANVKLKNGDPSYAIQKYLPLFLSFSKGGNKYSGVIKDGSYLLYQAFRSAGKNEKALEMLELYQELSDSLSNAANQQATIRFDFEQKALLDSLENVQERIELKEEYDQQVQVRNYGIMGLILLVVGGLFWYRYRREQQRAETQAAELAAAEQLNQRLQQVDKLKDQFLANTSHELRTPLNGIIGISEGLLGQEVSHEELQQNLSMVVSSGKRLASLVNDLLDFSRIKHADLTLRQRPTDLFSLVDVVLQVSITMAQGKNLRLINKVSKELPAASADEDRLSQVLYNLIGNAIKFTEEGEVSVYAGKDEIKELGIKGEHGKLLVAIQDSGIGIAADKLDEIFEEFTQADGSIQREYAGTGLGLSISRQLIEEHGGNMWAQSTLGKGSIFLFTLPITNELVEATPYQAKLTPLVIHAEKEVDLAPQRNSADQVHLLIVDDEPINHQVLKNHLRNTPFHLHSAMNGQEALDLLQQQDQRMDLILLDVMMPRMSGYEVAKKIREQFLPSELPIILITAKNQVSDLVQGLQTGANDFLAKPFSKSEFLARLQSHLSLRQINKATSRFVPIEFINTLKRKDITELRLGDYMDQDMTLMFADIRSYTTLAEGMTPEENFRFVNAYMQRMGPIIRRNKGFVNQYFGDGIMALFQQSARHALQAAIDMQEEIRSYNEIRLSKNRKSIRVGMGIHTGPLIMGIIGDENRTDTAVIADTVNVTARLEGLTKYYQTAVLVSIDSYHQLTESQQSQCRYLGEVQVKGRKKPMGIYECFAADTPEVARLKESNRKTFEQCLEMFTAGDMKEALKGFDSMLQRGDRVATYFVQKARYYVENGLPEGWNGVEVIDGK